MQPRRAKNPSGTAILQPCISGGRAALWLTCRAVLFASLVDDPSEHPEEFPTEQEQEQERERLFRLIEELVKWENSNNENSYSRHEPKYTNRQEAIPRPCLTPLLAVARFPWKRSGSV